VTYLAVCLVAPAPTIDGCSNSMLYSSKSSGTILYRENVRVLYSTELPVLSNVYSHCVTCMKNNSNTRHRPDIGLTRNLSLGLIHVYLLAYLL
jgi:hypothetical protein